MRTRIALFPVFADTLPVVRYLLKYRTDLEIIELLSPPGSCCCGKDASVLDNREPLGVIVRSSEETEFASWDALYLLQHKGFNLTTDKNCQIVYAALIENAKKNKKSVVDFTHITGLCDSREQIVERTTIQPSLYERKSFGSLERIRTFQIFIGGIVETENTFEVFLKLYGELSKSFRIAAFSSSKNAPICGAVSLGDVLYDNMLSENQKVYALESIIKESCKAKRADMVLMQLDEPLMPFNEMQTNGFGIMPFLVSKVVEPDYFICCLPYGYSSSSFLKECETGLIGCLGFSPDRWHLSNVMLDNTMVSNAYDMNMIHIPIHMVEDEIKRARSININIGCDVLNNYIRETIESIILAYQDFQMIDSIM